MGYMCTVSVCIWRRRHSFGGRFHRRKYKVFTFYAMSMSAVYWHLKLKLSHYCWLGTVTWFITLRGQRGRCRNIKGEPQIYGSFPNPKATPIVLWVWFHGGPWQTQTVYQIRSRYLQPLCKYWRGAALAQCHAHPFFCVWFYDGSWQTQAVYQIWSR